MVSPPQLFDLDARARRRDRAFRTGPALFVYERVFSDILERLSEVKRSFTSALLLGCPDPDWPQRLREVARDVTVIDPGSAFAMGAAGTVGDEESLDVEPGGFDLCVAIGTLDSVNNLPGALLRLRFALKPDGLLIGAIAGGETLPQLRQAMRAADAAAGAASPHVHPRIEPAALAQLLGSAGFEMPVVDIDRVRVGYSNLRDLVRDLRAMGVTNVLASRPRAPLTRRALAAADAEFSSAAVDSRTLETFEILYFAGWTPASAA